MNKVAIAEELGAKAFANGRAAIPCLDKNLMPLLEGVKVGDGEPIIRAWLKGFINAPMPE